MAAPMSANECPAISRFTICASCAARAFVAVAAASRASRSARAAAFLAALAACFLLIGTAFLGTAPFGAVMLSGSRSASSSSTRVSSSRAVMIPLYLPRPALLLRPLALGGHQPVDSLPHQGRAVLHVQ